MVSSGTESTVSVAGRTFTYDSVFGPDSTQAGLYGRVAPDLLGGFLDGYNATVSLRGVWFGLVWFGLVWLVWFGLVWFVWFGLFGLVWSGLVWYGLVWSGLVCLVCLVWSGLVIFSGS